MKKQTNNPSKRLTTTYIAALVIVAVLVVVGQILIRQTLDTQASDARVINIAGRQSMLSQQMTKLAFLIHESIGKEEFEDYSYEDYLDEFRNTAETWERAHWGLVKGDSTMKLPYTQSEAIAAMYEELQPFYQELYSATQLIVSTENEPTDSLRKALARKAIHHLLANEMQFQELMNQVTFQYELEAQGHLFRLKLTESALAAFQLAILAILGIWVFRPVVRKFALYYHLIQEKNNSLESLNHELQASEEEIRQNAEELLAMNENLITVKSQLENSLANEQASKTELQRTYSFIHHKNRQIEASINYAQRIQSSLLPPLGDLKELFSEAFVLFRPKDIVSGDFYWYTERDGKYIVAAVDCMGHGIPGAFMSLIGERMLHEIVTIDGITDAGKILDHLNENFRTALKQASGSNDDSMDLALCVVDTNRKSAAGLPVIQFAGARNSLVYVENGDMHEIRGDRMSVGGRLKAEEHAPFTQYELQLQAPASLYLFSDGLQDQFGGYRGRKFTKQRVKELLFANHRLPMHVQELLLDEELNIWMTDHAGGKHVQIDDITVIGFRIQ